MNVVLVLLCCVFHTVLCGELDMTVRVEPGKEECFYEKVEQNKYLYVEYQVIDAGQANLDIHFKIASPSGTNIVQEFMKSDGSHREQVTEAGDYQICFDNTFSTFAHKVIVFELMIESEDHKDDDPWYDDEEDDFNFDKVTKEEIYDMKIEDMKDILSRVRTFLNKAQIHQSSTRGHEARDRNLQENNYTRVNTWSFINMFLMLSVGAVQVVMVRSLFDDKSRMHKLWKS